MSSLAKAVSAALLVGVAGQAAADNTTAINRALTEIRQNPTTTRLSAGDAFVARSVVLDRNGNEHVHFDRTYNGLPVIGGDLIVHTKAGVFAGTNLTIANPINVSTTPKITADAAITAAGVKFGTTFDSTPVARLVVYARRATPALAYDVLYTGKRADKTPTRMHYMVDANTGAILDKWDAVETGTLPGGNYGTGLPAGTPNVTATTGVGKSLYEGTVNLYTQLNNSTHLYEMKDPTRGNTYITDIANGYRGNGVLMVDGDNKWGTGTTSDRASAAVDASYGFAMTWDFYKNVMGRLGIGGDGVGAFGAVHFEQNYNNAFWSNDCFCMAFGDGDGVHMRPLVALDVMGHEMSHGVTFATAGLAYSAESGGLNEANSDIMGTMVEFYANNPSDPGDYTIGESIMYPGMGPGATGKKLSVLRTMFKPSLDNISDDCFPAFDATSGSYYQFFTGTGYYAGGGKDPHYTSGVANHFFYLLAEGAKVPAGWGNGTTWNLTQADLVCNGQATLQGIGRDAAQRIWYRALTTYFTVNETYSQARAGTLSAAADLYGTGSLQYNAVAAAWDAVNVH